MGSQWENALCPVCRYAHDRLSTALVNCRRCHKQTDLWVCLLCGHVGCGRYHSEHARDHYLDTLHTYAIEVQTQQVRDYAGEGYVHRLVYNKSDVTTSMKVVEIADPQSNDAVMTRPDLPSSITNLEEEERLHIRLETLAHEYTIILSTQLEAQRHMYENKLMQLIKENELNDQENCDDTSVGKGIEISQQDKEAQQKAENDANKSKIFYALNQEKRQLEKSCETIRRRLEKKNEEESFMIELSAQLRANLASLEKTHKIKETELKEVRSKYDMETETLNTELNSLMARLEVGFDGSEK